MNFFYHNIFIHIEAVLGTVQRVFEEKKWKTRERKKTSGRSIRTRVMKISISGSFFARAFSHYFDISYLYVSTNKADENISSCMSSASGRKCLYEN